MLYLFIHPNKHSFRELFTVKIQIKLLLQLYYSLALIFNITLYNIEFIKIYFHNINYYQHENFITTILIYRDDEHSFICFYLNFCITCVII